MLKDRKNAGEDEITNEMLKCGGSHLWEQIYVLIDQVFKISAIPEEWKTNIVVPIFKKGEKLNPNNYRGINLLNTHLKLTTKIISNKLSQLMNLHDKQQGFRKGRSCVDAIFAIRQLCEKAHAFNKPTFFCFIDIEKAFDKVQLKHVIKILDKFKIPDNLINLIHDIYSNNTARIKTEGRLSGSIPVNQGIRQGDSFSPLLFNIVMDEIIGEIKNLKGYSLGDENITCVCYKKISFRPCLPSSEWKHLISNKQTRPWSSSEECVKYDAIHHSN